MQVAKRITNLRHVVVALQRATHKAAPKPASRSALSPSPPSPKVSHAHEDKLLFRSIPICVSQIERALVKRDARRRTLAALPAPASSSLPPSLLPDLLESLEVAEEYRRMALRERLAHLTHREANRNAVEKNIQLRIRRLTTQHRRSSHKRNNAQVEESTAVLPTLEAEKARLRAIQAEREAVREDKDLLQFASLLSRPYLSAKLWQYTLQKPLWVAWTSQRSSSGASSSATPFSDAQRVSLLYAWSKLTLGVLRDVIQDGRPLSRASPRFVVSLPRGVPKSTAPTEAAAIGPPTTPPHTPSLPLISTILDDTDALDLIAAQLSSDATNARALHHHMEEGERAVVGQIPSPAPASPVPAAALPTPAAAKWSHKTAVRSIRWLPRASTRLLPLLLSTLSVWQSVLKSVQVDDVLRLLQAVAAVPSGHPGTTRSPPALLQLTGMLVAVQDVATTTCMLAPSPPSPSDPDAMESFSDFSAELHRVLGGLEEALLEKVGRTRALLCEALVEEEVPASTQTPLTPRLSPEQTVQLLLQLNRLKALSPSSTDARRLVAHYCLLVFPQLRTGTAEVLQRKAQQTSLLAYVSRSQLSRLRQKGKPVQSVLENERQRSRLEQRQLAAAVRGARIADVQQQALLQLASQLSAQQLTTLLQVLVSHLTLHSESASSCPGGPPCRASHRQHPKRRGGRENIPRVLHDGQRNHHVLLTSALLVAEAVLLSDALHAAPSSSLTAPSQSPLHGQTEPLSLHGLVELWLSVAVLRPLVKEACQGPSSAAFTPSKRLLESLATQVLDAVYSRLEPLSVKKVSGSAGTPGSPSSSTLVAVLHKLACGVTKWLGEGDSRRGFSSYSSPAKGAVRADQWNTPVFAALFGCVQVMQQIVLAQSDRLVKELKCGEWDEASQEAFRRNLESCLNGVGLLDRVTMQVLNTIYAVPDEESMDEVV